VNVRINFFLRPGKNLIHVQVLLGNHPSPENDAALAGHADSPRGYRLLKLPRCLCGIEALLRWKPGAPVMSPFLIPHSCAIAVLGVASAASAADARNAYPFVAYAVRFADRGCGIHILD